MNIPAKPRVAIIGAGASGLAMARYVRESGGEAVVYERSATVGGVWKFDAAGIDPAQPAYSALRANSSRKVMEFAGHTFASEDDYPSRSDVEQYLVQYRDAHGLAACIHHEADVRSIERVSESKWSVSLGGEALSEFFDYVVVCTGLYKVPTIPPLYKQLDPAVKLTHSALFRNATAYAGKRVLIAGLGNSGADAAVELCRVGAEVAVSSPRGAWVIPKHIGGVPYDYYLTNLTFRESLGSSEAAFEQLILQEYRRTGIDVDRYRQRLAPNPLDLSRSRMTMNSEVLPLIEDGSIKLLSIGERVSAGEFSDACGRSFKFDAVIAATGYQREFPFLDATCQPHQGTVLSLYKHVFHPKVPRLAFLGMCGVVGAIFPVVELQARWVASCFLGARTLPSSDEMTRMVNAHNQMALANSIKPSRVVQVPYMEALALELGLGDAQERMHKVRTPSHPVVADIYSESLNDSIGDKHARNQGTEVANGAGPSALPLSCFRRVAP